MTRLGNALLFALLIAPTVASSTENRTREPFQGYYYDLPQRGVHGNAKHCLDCHDASYKRHFLCNRIHQCVDLDWYRADGDDTTTRPAARRHSSTTTRRIKCAY